MCVCVSVCGYGVGCIDVVLTVRTGRRASGRAAGRMWLLWLLWLFVFVVVINRNCNSMELNKYR